jgi:hypothetical protein
MDAFYDGLEGSFRTDASRRLSDYTYDIDNDLGDSSNGQVKTMK